MMVKKNILLLITLTLNTLLLYSQAERKYIREGNKHYNAQNYGNAEVAYQKALQENQNSFEAAFNLADAFYQQGKYNKAAEKLQELATKQLDASQKAGVFHNLGNTYFDYVLDTLQKGGLPEALKKIDNTIEAYKNALKADHTRNKTRHNLQMAQLVKRELKKQQQQQQNQQNNQNKENNEQQNNQEQQNQQNNQQNNQQSDADNDGIPDEVEKGPNSKPRDSDNDGIPDYQDTESDNDNIPDQREAGKNPKEPKDTDNDGKPDYRDADSNNDGTPDSEQMQALPISKEDALRILQALEMQDQALQEKIKKQKARKSKVSAEKDW